MEVLSNIIRYQIEYLLSKAWSKSEVKFAAVQPGELHLLNHMALIVLSHADFWISLKFFMHNQDLERFLAFRFKEAGGVAGDMKTVDWFKEFSNTVAGRIKYVCSKYSIDLQHSLPFYLPGYFQVFFKEEKSPCYEFTFLGMRIYSTFTAELRDSEEIARIKPIQRHDVFQMNDELLQDSQSFDL